MGVGALGVGDSVLDGHLLDVAAHAVGSLVGARGRIQSHKVGRETSNVGRSHAGAGCSGSAAGLVGADDVDTRGKDLDDRAKVAERGLCVVLVDGTDGADAGLVGRAGVAGVDVVVAGGDSEEEARVDGGFGGLVQGGAGGSAERQVSDGSLGAAAVLAGVGSVLSGEVEAGDGLRDGSRAVSTKHLHAEELNLLGHTVGLAANGAGDVGAVAVVVVVGAVDKVLEHGGAALEVGVASEDTGVQDVGAHSGASRGIVDVARRKRGRVDLVRDARQAPGRGSLRGDGGASDDCVSLDLRNTRKSLERRHKNAAQRSRETVEVADAENIVGSLAEGGDGGLEKSLVGRLHDDDVLVLDDIAIALDDNRCGRSHAEKRENSEEAHDVRILFFDVIDSSRQKMTGMKAVGGARDSRASDWCFGSE